MDETGKKPHACHMELLRYLDLMPEAGDPDSLRDITEMAAFWLLNYYISLKLAYYEP